MITLPLPEGVRASFTTQILDQKILHPKECSLIQDFDTARKLDFCRGRYSAHQCLDYFDADDAILKNSHGAPIWPKGYTGSISHTQGTAGAMVTKKEYFQSVGLDLERIGRVTRDLWDLLFTPWEIKQLESLKTSIVDFASTLFFSLKEAFYKMQFGISKQFLDFQDCEISLENKKCHLSPLIQSDQAPFRSDLHDIGYHRHGDLVISYILLRHDEPKHQINDESRKTDRHHCQ